MKPSLDTLFKKLSAYPKAIPQLFANTLHLFLDRSGNILEISDKWSFHYLSMVDELMAVGHIRDHFEFPDNPPPAEAPLTLHNKKDFLLLELPETFYSSFSMVVLRLLRIEENLLYGALRVTGVLPNITLQRPNCVIYADGDGRLAGFNETFYHFFKDAHKSPQRMLGLSLSRFLTPTPQEIQAGWLAAAPLPETAMMKKLFAGEFPGAGSLSGIAATANAGLEIIEGGLRFSNPTEDYTNLVISAPVPQNRDFVMEMEFTVLEGHLPLLTLAEAGGPAPLRGHNEYSVTPDNRGTHFQLKRKGVVQQIYPIPAPAGRRLWRLCRTGRSLVFFQNGERTLSFHDPNYLHADTSSCCVGLRAGSAILISSLRLFSSEKPTAISPELPVTRLKILEPNAFVINPLDNIFLAGNHPGISGYVLENATEMHRRLDFLRLENQRILTASGLGSDPIQGKSAAFLAVKETAAKAAASDVSILIEGETGTGKEVLAHYIHDLSGRKHGLFVKVDCSAIPRELVESELFGHEKGAFTGAVAQRPGLLEQAHGGTLFLDEIGNLTLEVQAKLLHFFQDHSVTRVGGRRPISIDVRVISATNIPLAELVKRKEFRTDLYYRMDVVSLTLPPLRDRKEDLPGLCRHFIRQFNTQHGRKIQDFSAAAYEKIFAHPWPGNVRELKNTVERAVIFCEEENVPPGLLSFASGGRPTGFSGRKGPRPLKGLDEKDLRRIFQEQGGVVAKVAKALGVTPDAVYDKAAKLGLTAEGLRRSVPDKNPP